MFWFEAMSGSMTSANSYALNFEIFSYEYRAEIF